MTQLLVLAETQHRVMTGTLALTVISMKAETLKPEFEAQHTCMRKWVDFSLLVG